VIEEFVDIVTRDGRMDTFVCRPERNGPFPVIFFYMDAPAIREELRDMARRFATAGYYVVLPNLYYRSGVTEIGPVPPDPEHPARIRMTALMASLDIPLVASDTDAMLAFIAKQPDASPASIGCVGYCMSGQYAVDAAVRHPDRVAAAASIYGVKLVTDRDDSPHLGPARSPAEFYFGCAEIDRYVPLSMVDDLRRSLAEAPNAEVELYPGVEHGFAFPQRPVYDKPSAERHWERLLALFARRLQRSNSTAQRT
jgi:carboxymethylenebutenolidase